MKRSELAVKQDSEAGIDSLFSTDAFNGYLAVPHRKEDRYKIGNLRMFPSRKFSLSFNMILSVKLPSHAYAAGFLVHHSLFI
jgi:hypothetical protein